MLAGDAAQQPFSWRDQQPHALSSRPQVTISSIFCELHPLRHVCSSASPQYLAGALSCVTHRDASDLQQLANACCDRLSYTVAYTLNPKAPGAATPPGEQAVGFTTDSHLAQRLIPLRLAVHMNMC